MTNPIVFNLELAEETVILRDKDGKEQTILVKELTGDQRDKWMTITAKKLRTDKAGNNTLSSFDGIQSSLISLGCFYQGGDRDGENVTFDEANNWPARVNKAVFDMIQRMSGLDSEALETEGN